jgi:DNA-binding response OmpR family regulator
MKFLLVDNNESIQRWHKKELEEEGYEIIISSTGEEALKKLKTEKPDIIIMEFLLPDIDGAVLIRKIKSKRPGIPLLLSTAFDFQELFKKLSLDAYVMKSSNLRELKEEIMNYADVNKVIIMNKFIKEEI